MREAEKLALALELVPRTKPVLTVFYRNGKVVKRIRSRWPINAATNLVPHMRRNSYEADTAEVYSTESAKLYAVMRRSVDGNLRTVFETEYSKKEESPIYLKRKDKQHGT